RGLPGDPPVLQLRRRRMRRYATWITGHRKTVIFGWIAALLIVGFVSSKVGSDFSEEFKLPSSDSQEAFDLLETKFPAQSGDSVTIVYRDAEHGAYPTGLVGGPVGVKSPEVRRKMTAV